MTDTVPSALAIDRTQCSALICALETGYKKLRD